MNNINKKNMPSLCPSCGKDIQVTKLSCAYCGTGVEGVFPFPVLPRLTPEEQDFLVMYVKASGSLKDLAKLYDISYPTVRNRLDALIDRIKRIEAEQKKEG